MQWRSCFRQLPVPPDSALSRQDKKSQPSCLFGTVTLRDNSIRVIPLKKSWIDVDAVINESQNSLSEPSFQFVTISSVVVEEAIPTYSVATSQTFRRELEMAETRFTLRERLS